MHYWWASPNIPCGFSILFLLFFSLIEKKNGLGIQKKLFSGLSCCLPDHPTSILMEKMFWYTNSFHIPLSLACHVILCQFSFHTQVSYNNISLMEINGTHINSSDSNISLLYFKAKIYLIISVCGYCCL